MKMRITIVVPLETNVGSRFCSFCSDRRAFMMGLMRKMMEDEKMSRIQGSPPVTVRMTNSVRIRRRIRITIRSGYPKKWNAPRCVEGSPRLSSPGGAVTILT